MKRVLICEDNKINLNFLSAIVKRAGYEPIESVDGESCIRKVTEEIHLVLLDFNLPDMNGLDILIGIKRKSPETKVIMVTKEGSNHLIKKAFKLGASNYVLKPFNEEKINAAINEALKTAAIQKEFFLTSKNQAMKDIYDQALIVAKSNANIIIQGESGTGKEVFAKYLHQNSERSQKPFVAINCPALPQNLVESELFGHIRGAFTGANSNRTGKFSEADGGTIFLDEVADLSYEVQIKLLRVIQEKVIEPIGTNKIKKVDVRFICASNKDLREEVAHKRFRLDLYYRLAGFEFVLPNLSERKEDISPLSNLFLAQFCAEDQRPILSLSDKILSQILTYSWPGNIRELQSLIRRLIIISPVNILQIDSIPEQFIAFNAKPESYELEDDKPKNLKRLEKSTIEKSLADCKYNLTSTAKILGISRTTLYRKLKQYQIEYRKIGEKDERKGENMRKVLVADDNEVNRDLMGRILEQEKCTVIFAKDGIEAVNLANNKKFDLIMMDIRMPGMDGFEAADSIKKDSVNSSTPIFAVTTNVGQEDCNHAQKVKMAAIIAKPINISSVREALQYLSTSMSRFKQINVNLPNEIENKVDCEIIDEIAAMADPMDPNFFTEQVDRFKKYNHELQEKLQIAVDSRCRDSIESIAHSMAGSAGSFGARNLANLCNKLEINALDYSTKEIIDTLQSIKYESEYFYDFLNQYQYKRVG